MAEATHDVISISSSDDDSDCQIVKVSSSFGGRIKSTMRWQYQPYKLQRRRRRNIPRRLHEDADDDLQDEEPVSNQNTQSFEAGVTAGGDAARNDCSQSMDQSNDALRYGLADHSSIKEMSDAKTERSVTMRVDPTDPLANRHHTADLEPSMLPPPFPPQMPDPSNQMSTLDNENKQQESRSRSCSVATLDFPLERADAQLGDVQGLEGDAQGIDSDMLDEQHQLLLGGPIILADCANHPQVIANQAVLPNEDGSLSALGSAPEWNRDNIKTEESDQAAIKTEDFQDVDTGSLQQFKRASTTSRGRLPRVGKRRAWSSIINFAGYETLLGPLFTQQKETIRSVTYDDMVEERAEMNKK